MMTRVMSSTVVSTWTVRTRIRDVSRVVIAAYGSAPPGAAGTGHASQTPLWVLRLVPPVGYGEARAQARCALLGPLAAPEAWLKSESLGCTQSSLELLAGVFHKPVKPVVHSQS